MTRLQPPEAGSPVWPALQRLCFPEWVKPGVGGVPVSSRIPNKCCFRNVVRNLKFGVLGMGGDPFAYVGPFGGGGLGV